MADQKINFQGVTITGPAEELEKFVYGQLGYNPTTHYKTRTGESVIPIADMSTSYVFNSMLMQIIDHLRSLQSYDDSDLQRHKNKYMHVDMASDKLEDIIDLYDIAEDIHAPSFVALHTELRKRGVV
jgi:hypothetical protein